MRKLTAALIVVALALASVAALAAGVNNIYQDFEDFTLMYPEDCPIELEAKAENALYFTLYSPATSESNFSNNLNCVWNSGYDNLYSFEPQDLLDYTMGSIVSEAANQGFSISNVVGVKADRLTLGGKDAIAIAYTYDADYTNLGLDLQGSLTCVSVVTSDPSLGTYTFTVTASNQVGIDELSTVLDSLVWKN